MKLVVKLVAIVALVYSTISQAEVISVPFSLSANGNYYGSPETLPLKIYFTGVNLLPTFNAFTATRADAGTSKFLSTGPTFEAITAMLTNGVRDDILVYLGNGGYGSSEKFYFYGGIGDKVDLIGYQVSQIELRIDQFTTQGSPNISGGFASGELRYYVSSVPEPSTSAIVLLSLITLLFVRIRKHSGHIC